MRLALGLSLGAQGDTTTSGSISITSSDGDPASLTDNGDGTYDVIINSVTVGTITQAQVNAGGWITVVAPAVGMSGNNVVQTTEGFVIYVGTVPIETDVVVLANGVPVGFGLPFDASAYPSELLEVTYSYSVGADTLDLTDEARAAALKVAQFNDTYFGLESIPAGLRTRRATVAFRVEGEITTGSFGSTGMRNISREPFAIQNGPTGFRMRGVTADFNTGWVDIAGGGPDEGVSFMAAIDLDGGLPGGETYVLWASVNGGAPQRVTGSTVTTGNPATALNYAAFGSTNGNTVGGRFDIPRHIWYANEALDPAVHWAEFFEADGTVKALPADGVVQSITPIVFIAGDGFVTATNLGSGGALGVSRNPPTVITL